MNLIKLNSIIDLKAQEAVKKSLEFFFGRYLDSGEFKASDMNPVEAIKGCLEEHDIFLMDNAIQKKFNEFFTGKDYEGLICQSSLVIDRSKLKHLAILSFLKPEQTSFLTNLHSIDYMKVIHAENTKKGLEKAKDTLGNFKFISNESDRELAEELSIKFDDIQTLF